MKTRACCAALVMLIVQSDDRLARTCCSGGEIMASPASALLAVPAPIETAPCDDAQLTAQVLAALAAEYCHKYAAEQFTAISRAAGLCPREQWTNEQLGFSVQLLEPDTGGECRPLEAEGDIETEARSTCRIAF